VPVLVDRGRCDAMDMKRDYLQESKHGY
jgi:hypothetical protein